MPILIAPLIPGGIVAVQLYVILPGIDEFNVTNDVLVSLQIVWIGISNITSGFGYTSIVIVKLFPVHIPAIGVTLKTNVEIPLELFTNC